MPQVPAAPLARTRTGAIDARFTTPQVAAPDARLQPETVATPLISTPQLQPRLLKSAGVNPESIDLAPKKLEPYRLQAQAQQNISSAFTDALKYWKAEQLKVNATAVDDALQGNGGVLQVKRDLEWGTKPDPNSNEVVGGFRNATGQDAVKLDPKTVSDEFDRRVKSISDSLSNREQRQAFGVQAERYRSQMMDNLAQHQANQSEAWRTASYKSQMTNVVESARGAYTDDGQLNEVVASAQRTAATIAFNDGAPPAVAEQMQREATTAAVSNAVLQAVQDKKMGRANELLKTWSEKMTSGAVRELRTKIESDVSAYAGEQLGQKVWTGATMAGQTADSPSGLVNQQLVYAITAQSESGGKETNPDGTRVVSPKGAAGIMQVMPATGRDPGFGVRPSDGTPEDDARVGRDYIDAMTKRYAGDMRKAWSAYNAGPGATDEAIQEYGSEWFIHMPAETQAYVRSNLAKLEKGGGESAPFGRMSREEMYAQIDTLAPGEDNLEVRKTAKLHVDKMFAVAEADERKVADNAARDAMGILVATNGDWNAVPGYIVQELDPQDVTALQGYATNLRTGTYTTTDADTYTNIATYSREEWQKITPADLARMRTKLSPSDYKKAEEWWIAARKPVPGREPGLVDAGQVTGITNSYLASLGENLKPISQAGKDRLALIQKTVIEGVINAQLARGERFSDYASLYTFVGQMFARQLPYTVEGPFGMQFGKGAMPVLTAKYDEIPPNARNAARDKLRTTLKREPTRAEIVEQFQRSQFYRVPVPPPRTDFKGMSK